MNEIIIDLNIPIKNQITNNQTNLIFDVMIMGEKKISMDDEYLVNNLSELWATEEDVLVDKLYAIKKSLEDSLGDIYAN